MSAESIKSVSSFTFNFITFTISVKVFMVLFFIQFASLETPGYVGFANLPNQVHRKSVKKGFEFTLMVVGESGLGKSTLVDSLFDTDIYPERIVPSAGGGSPFIQ